MKIIWQQKVNNLIENYMFYSLFVNLIETKNKIH